MFSKKLSSFLLLLIALGCRVHEAPGLASGSLAELRGERPGARFGAAGDIVGDINGDGFADVVIGAPKDSKNGTDSGTLYIYFGSKSGVLETPDLTIVGNIGDELGSSIAGLGDVNGDGVDDFAAVAKSVSKLGIVNQSVVLIFFGSKNGLLQTVDEKSSKVRFSATADRIFIAPGSLPLTVSSAGDIDQNQQLDLAIGSESEDTVYIFLAGSLFPIAERAFLIDADIKIKGASGSRLGASISYAGDVNNQNVGLKSRFGDDFLIGAPDENQKGGAYLVLGSQGLRRGTVTALDMAIHYVGTHPNDQFGASVTGVGDFDGDGFGDIAIGAPGVGNGRAEVYFGQFISGPATTQPLIISGEADGDQFGTSLSGFLPLGLSGSFPFAIGAPFSNFVGSEAGSLYLMSKAIFAKDTLPNGASISAATSDRRIRNPFGASFGQGHFGSWMKGGLDVDGDGSGDILVGAPDSDSAGPLAGAAVVLW